MWVIPIVRDEVLWVHEATANFLKTVSKMNKKDKAAGKKAVEVKTMYSTALKSAPAYRKDRRLFLAQLLKDFWLLISECPGLLGKFGTYSI